MSIWRLLIGEANSAPPAFWSWTFFFAVFSKVRSLKHTENQPDVKLKPDPKKQLKINKSTQTEFINANKSSFNAIRYSSTLTFLCFTDKDFIL